MPEVTCACTRGIAAQTVTAQTTIIVIRSLHPFMGSFPPGQKVGWEMQHWPGIVPTRSGCAWRTTAGERNCRLSCRVLPVGIPQFQNRSARFLCDVGHFPIRIRRRNRRSNWYRAERIVPVQGLHLLKINVFRGVLIIGPEITSATTGENSYRVFVRRRKRFA
jgi:hypothetical protein